MVGEEEELRSDILSVRNVFFVVVCTCVSLRADKFVNVFLIRSNDAV